MEKLRKNAAGIDIGAKMIFIGVEGEQVKSFETFTEGFYQACDYLISKRIDTVAMEATGVYWIILYEILESAGLNVWLVDGRQTKQVPGRKTDVKDCQWIQQLHSYGLLNRCFVPDEQVKEVRSYQRLREDHIRSAAMHINHMQKALTEMNIRLKEVLSQIHGASGIAMIEAILAGERDKGKLLSMCHKSIRKKKSEEVFKALEGYYTPAHLFALQQAYDAYRFYEKQIADCDKAIEMVLQETNNQRLPDEKVKGRKPIRHHKPDVNRLGDHLLCLFSGRDATLVPGITDYSWLQLYSEIGNDLSKWPSEKHFTSWLGLAPGQHNSGRKTRTKKKGRPKAGQIFRQVAQSLMTSKKIAFGAFGRRIRSRKGPAIAIKATARKLAIQYYRLMVNGKDFMEHGVEQYQKKLFEQKQKHLNKLAKEFNMALVPS
jgi:transposase